jgi:hypothetical protein
MELCKKSISEIRKKTTNGYALRINYGKVIVEYIASVGILISFRKLI